MDPALLNNLATHASEGSRFHWDFPEDFPQVSIQLPADPTSLCNQQGLNQPSIDDETWKAPDDGWIKLNLYVFKNEGQNQAACGGVFCDCQGFWRLGYIVKQNSDPPKLMRESVVVT